MFLFILFFMLGASLSAQNAQDWNGYFQVRYTDDFKNNHSFEIRRAKLWLHRKTSFSNRLYYKIQGKFSFKNTGDFVLQDVFAEYRFSYGWMRLGQQKPDFSLERCQPDYLISSSERALVVNALIPAAESGARDLGLQFHARSQNQVWRGSLGLFNGDGGNRVGNADRHLLFTSRQQLNFSIFHELRLHLGVSAYYRKVTNTIFSKILGTNSLFSGHDIRYGTEVILADKNWSLQSEYIEAQLNKHHVYGWYLLGEYQITKKHILGLQTEYFSDLILAKKDKQAFSLNYSWLFHNQQAKFMADLRMAPVNTGSDYSIVIQTQLFFN